MTRVLFCWEDRDQCESGCISTLVTKSGNSWLMEEPTLKRRQSLLLLFFRTTGAPRMSKDLGFEVGVSV